jgi:hypothetical protein
MITGLASLHTPSKSDSLSSTRESLEADRIGQSSEEQVVRSQLQAPSKFYISTAHRSFNDVKPKEGSNLAPLQWSGTLSSSEKQ